MTLFLRSGVCIPYLASESENKYFSALKKLEEAKLFNEIYLKILIRAAWIGSEQHKYTKSYYAEIKFSSLAKQLNTSIDTVKRVSMMAKELGLWIVKPRPHHAPKILFTRSIFDVLRMVESGVNPRKHPPKTVLQAIPVEEKLHLQRYVRDFRIEMYVCRNLLKKMSDLKHFRQALEYIKTMSEYARNKIRSMTAYFCKIFFMMKNQKFNWKRFYYFKKEAKITEEKQKKMNYLLLEQQKRQREGEQSDEDHKKRQAILEVCSDDIYNRIEDTLSDPAKREAVIIKITRDLFGADTEEKSKEMANTMGLNNDDPRLIRWMKELYVLYHERKMHQKEDCHDL